MYILVGLGNPGEKYARTRHNAGRMAADSIAEKGIDGVKVITPDSFMNVSGPFVSKYVHNTDEAERLIVVYDDLDLPLGTMRLSFDRGAGGHKGVESIISSLGTEKFIRIRIGISPVLSDGDMKKIQGAEHVDTHVLGEFRPAEMETIQKVLINIITAVTMIVEKDLQSAMTQFNS